MATIHWKNSDDVRREEKDVEIAKLRNRRNHLLTGWDKYASNVAFGVYEVSQSDKETMIAWYHGLLDMKEDAINNPPNIIKYLIGEKPLENDIIVKGE